MRTFLLLPLAMLLSSIIVGAINYNKEKVRLTEDLNEVMMRLANAKSELFAAEDTIKALRHLKETVNQPITYSASDLVEDNRLISEGTFFQLALLYPTTRIEDSNNPSRKVRKSTKELLSSKGIVSDSIVIIPQGFSDGIAIELTGYTQCNMASVFFASDQRLSLILFLFSIVTFLLMMLKRQKVIKDFGSFEQKRLSSANESITLKPNDVIGSKFLKEDDPIDAVEQQVLTPNNTIDQREMDLRNYKLTPMQRRFMTMMLQAKDYRVGKYDLCDALWDGKDNAEESLYTLIKRTKLALKGSGIEIICNRGESYQLHIND